MSANVYLTPPEVATLLGVGVGRVIGWIHAGKLPAANVGDGALRPRWRIRQSALDAFLEARASRPAPTTAPRRRRAKTDTQEIIERY